MKIYTKTGDSGLTSLFGGKRVKKNHPLIEVYGTVDELNSLLGIIASQKETPEELKEKLIRVQNELFSVGADLATPWNEKTPGTIQRVPNDLSSTLEKEMDQIEAYLPPLKTFILPGGHPVSALIHHARTVCRRAERLLIDLFQANEVNPEIEIYLNRLSDWLFMMARWVNFELKHEDIPWKA